jgi:hypothetical protein
MICHKLSSLNPIDILDSWGKFWVQAKKLV